MSDEKHDHEQEQTQKSRRAAFRVFTCGLSSLLAVVLVVLVAVVAAVRNSGEPYYYINPNSNVTGLKSVYDSQLGWRNIPDSTGSTYGNAVQINSHGLRDREYAWKKPPDVKRILVLGDSYVWGYGVAQNEIFTEVLEDSLASEPPKWEVINTGVSGWGTDQQYLYLLQEGFRYSPDLVVVAYFIGNDTHNCLSSKQYGISKPVFVDTSLKVANVPVPDPRAAKNKLMDLEVPTKADPIDLTVAILAEMGKQCADRDCDFVFVKFGMFHQAFHTSDFLGWNERLIAETPPLAHVHLLDLDEAFTERQISQDELLLGNYDGHWNAFGHEAVAQILERFLREQGLLE
jgi:hypothetical protein